MHKNTWIQRILLSRMVNVIFFIKIRFLLINKLLGFGILIINTKTMQYKKTLWNKVFIL